MEKAENTQPERKKIVKNNDDTRCRLFLCWRSKCADNLGNPKVFLVIYSFLTTMQGMLYTYFIGVMTSFEEHFQLKSGALGLVLSIGEFVPVFAALICSYYCGSGDRPRWMAFCMFLIGLGCYMITLPYYILGVPPRGDIGVNKSISDEVTLSALCQSDEISTIKEIHLNLSSACKVASTQENNVYAVVFYLLGYTIFNNGSVILYIVGTPYLDDNVQQKNSPIYLAVICSMRSIGPLMGFILSYICLAIYVNPTENSIINPKDPHWIGAWWLGYLIMGTLALAAAFLVGQFPVRLRSRHMTAAMELIAISHGKQEILEENLDKKSISAKIIAAVKEVLPTVRRVITNVPYLLRLGSSLCTWFALESIVLYLPKYLEHQFRKTQSEASIWAGATLIAPSIVGTLLVGVVIHKIQPTSRQFAMAIVISKAIFSVIMLSLMSIKCDNAIVLGLDEEHRVPVCDDICECSSLPFAPVCGFDERNYLSACHAGCTTMNTSLDTWIYQNCSCITDGRAAANLCDENCHYFNLYVVLLLASNFLLSVHVIGEVMLVLRCVLIQDKTIALGIFSAGLSLLVFIPEPLIFSRIVDSTCSLWSSTCGETGNCLLYDLDTFRYVIHCVPFACLFGATILDALFWYKAKGIVLFGEEQGTSQKQNDMPTIATIY